MAIVVKKGDGRPKTLEPVPIGQERQMQQFIEGNPEIIPICEIDSGARIDVLDREFPVSAGNIDIVGIDDRGIVYIIETKKKENTTSRFVISQVLDYGAAVNRLGPHQFLERLEERLYKKTGEGLEERLQRTLEADENILDTMLNNLRNGYIRYIIMLDKISENLKGLVRYLNQNSNFSIYLVEVEFYEHEDLTIAIPRLFGEEIQKVTSFKPLNEEEKSYIDFFQKVVQKFNKRVDVEVPAPSGRPYQQILTDIDKVHFEWVFQGKGRKMLGVEMHFESRDRDLNVSIMKQLLQHKDEMVRVLGSEPVIDLERGGKSTRFGYRRQVVEMDEELVDWAVDTMEKFYGVLSNKTGNVQIL